MGFATKYNDLVPKTRKNYSIIDFRKVT
jgi:hypothetical protein